jgi:hypothetical protein
MIKSFTVIFNEDIALVTFIIVSKSLRLNIIVQFFRYYILSICFLLAQGYTEKNIYKVYFSKDILYLPLGFMTILISLTVVMCDFTRRIDCKICYFILQRVSFYKLSSQQASGSTKGMRISVTEIKPIQISILVFT